MAKDEILKQLQCVIKEAKSQRMAAEEVKTEELEKGYNVEAAGRADIRISDCKWIGSNLQSIVNIYKYVND